jgi:hypothetical protein
MVSGTEIFLQKAVFPVKGVKMAEKPLFLRFSSSPGRWQWLKRDSQCPPGNRQRASGDIQRPSGR